MREDSGSRYVIAFIISQRRKRRRGGGFGDQVIFVLTFRNPPRFHRQSMVVAASGDLELASLAICLVLYLCWTGEL